MMLINSTKRERKNGGFTGILIVMNIAM